MKEFCLNLMLPILTLISSINFAHSENISIYDQNVSYKPMIEVVVSATRRETPLSDVPDVLKVITRKEIEIFNSLSIGEIFRYTAGPSVETGTGSGFPDRSVIGLNGLPAKYTLVLVDGAPLLSEHIHTGVNIEYIPPSIIERIEVIRGAASAQYGSDAIGGIVNIITKKPAEKTKFVANASCGSYDTYDGDVAFFFPLHQKFKFSMGVNRQESEGQKIKFPTNRIDNMGYKELNLFSNLEFNPLPSLNFFFNLIAADNQMDWQGKEAESSLSIWLLASQYQINDKLDFSAKMASSKWKAKVNNELNKYIIPEAFLTWKMSNSHILTGGINYRNNQFRRTAVVTSDQEIYSAFLQHEWRLNQNLTIMNALRMDDVEDVEAVFVPKISCLYSPSSYFRLRVALARGFHAPTPQELYEEGYGHGGRALRFGNPNLKPEYSSTFSSGLEIFPLHALNFALYLYVSDIDNIIVPVYEGPWEKDPTKDVWRRTNIEKAYVWGGEFTTQFVVSDNLKLETGYTYTDNKVEDSKRHLPYNPGASLYFKAVSIFPLSDRWKISGFVGLNSVFNRYAWNWKPASDAPPDDPSGLITYLNDQQKIDAGIALELAGKYSFYLNFYNILQQELEYLDDAYTVFEGDLIVKAGFKLNF